MVDNIFGNQRDEFDPEELPEEALEELLKQIESINPNAGLTEEKFQQYQRPFPVAIAHDYRDINERGPEGDLFGYTGICLGLFSLNTDFESLGELTKLTELAHKEQVPDANPLIYVPAQGAYIWGIECDWISLQEWPDVADLAARVEEQRKAGCDPFLDAVLSEVQEILYQNSGT